MKYKFYPNTYDYSKIKVIGEKEFLSLMIKYRNDFELFLSRIINFKSIDAFIYSLGGSIPAVNDIEYNFYHKYSSLGSNYIFLRNNIHIENLSDEEINVIRSAIYNKKVLDNEFLMNTYKRVLYEDGDYTMFGIPMKKNMVPSKAVVFELSYDQKKLTQVSQLKVIDKAKEMVDNFIKEEIKKRLDTDIYLLVYNAIPDIYNSNTVVSGE